MSWEEKAKSYSKSFKQEELEDVREKAYLQGVRELRQEFLKLQSKITYPQVPSHREGFYERGFREGIEALLRIFKESRCL